MGLSQDESHLPPTEKAIPASVRRSHSPRIATGGSHCLAAHRTSRPKATHQVFDGVARHRNHFTLQLPPELLGSIELKAGVPDPFDVWHQKFVWPDTGAVQQRREKD